MNFLENKIILIVDDEPELREILTTEFRFQNALVYEASNITDAKIILANHKIDLIVSDIRMPGGTGIELLDHVRADIEVKRPYLILITGFADIEINEAYDKGADDLIQKPFSLDRLIESANLCFKSHKNKMDIDLTSNQLIYYHFSQNLFDAFYEKTYQFSRGCMTFKVEQFNSLSALNIDYGYCFNFRDAQIKFNAELKWFLQSKDKDFYNIGVRIKSGDEKFYEAIQKLGVKFLS
jgi:DNA-binding response OmpR family regulator